MLHPRKDEPGRIVDIRPLQRLYSSIDFYPQTPNGSTMHCLVAERHNFFEFEL